MPGLRERKKERTRDAIQREALRLIADQGYDATTCEQIAADAGVSPATLFRYFATKEDIVLQDVYDPMIAEAVRNRPDREAPLTAVRRGVADVFAEVLKDDLEAVRQRTALILSVPALRARSREQQDGLRSHLAVALAERTETDAGDLDIEVAASVCAASMALAVERWARDGGDLPHHVDAALLAVARLARGNRR
jgi:AcrR family transcriptional regulator